MKAAGVWNGAESTRIINGFLHMLALADKTNLEFLQRAISMSLDLVMKAALENLVHG